MSGIDGERLTFSVQDWNILSVIGISGLNLMALDEEALGHLKGRSETHWQLADTNPNNNCWFKHSIQQCSPHY